MTAFEIVETYQVIEAQNAQSERAGVAIEARNLFDAKRKATRMQFFQGTVLTVCAANGAPIAVKEGGKWRDAQPL